MSQEIAAMSFSRNHSRQDTCRPGCSEIRGFQSGFSSRNFSSPLRSTTTSPGSTFTPARQRDGATLLDQPLGLRLLGGGDQVHGAELVVVAPAAPVVELLEVAFDTITGRQRGIGHRSDPFVFVRSRGIVWPGR